MFSPLVRWRFRTLFIADQNQIKKQIVLLAVLLSCLMDPSVLVTLYSGLSASYSNTVWFVIDLVGLGLLFSHGRFSPSFEEIWAYERTLPLTARTRLLLDYLDAFWIHIPVLFLVLMSGFVNIVELYHQHTMVHIWKTFPRVLLGLLVMTVINFSIAHKFSRKYQASPPTRTIARNAALVKIMILWRNERSRVLGTVVWTLLLSTVGWLVARTPNPEQPKIAVSFVLFGLTLLSAAQFPELLRNWDIESAPFLNTLPLTRKQLFWLNSYGYFRIQAFLLVQSTIWVWLNVSDIWALFTFVISGIALGYILLTLQLRTGHWNFIISPPLIILTAVALQGGFR